MFKSIDKRLEELGFKKISEGNYGATYAKVDKEFGFVHCIAILNKELGDHIIHSYQKGANSDGFNNTVGMTYKEAKLAIKKFRQLKRRFKW